jgi:hypothetical protein
VFIATKVIKQNGNKRVSLKTIQNKSGWGYQILVNDSLYINQETIPVIQGNKAFVSKEDAEKIGNLMITKIKQHSNKLPTITVQELDSCGIIR